MRFASKTPPRSLTAQLILASASALLIVTGLIAGASFVGLEWRPLRLVQFGGHEQIAEVAEDLIFDAQGTPRAKGPSPGLDAMYDALPKDTAFRVMAMDGTVLLSSQPGEGLGALGQIAFDPSSPATQAWTTSGNNLSVKTAVLPGRGRPFVVQVAQSERLSRYLRDDGGDIVVRAAFISSLLAATIFFCISLVIIQRMVKPLRNISLAASCIAPRNLTAHLDGSRLPSELTPLIDAFNQALRRLEHGYKVQQDFLACAAHELKTPLALIRASIESDDVHDRQLLLKDVDFMARHVSQLLHLAEASEPENYAFGEVNLISLVADVAEQLQRLANKRQVEICHRHEQRVTIVHADAGALFVLVKNLLENALLHSPKGGKVWVATDRGGLSVIDTGPGIPLAEMPHLFKRFWRGPAETDGGAGLGLAICQEIALAHGSTLHAENRAQASGARFTLTFGDLNPSRSAMTKA